MNTATCKTGRDFLWCRGGGVPGGHYVLYDGVRKPFIPSMTECHSIPLRHSDVVIDIGAYVGTFAIYCARFPVRQVRAFEPCARTSKILDLTQLPNLQTYSAAVIGDDRDTVDFYVSKGIGVTNSLVPSKAKVVQHGIRAIPYWTAIEGATIVKIDIEGGEYSIDLDDLITSTMRGLMIDFHPVGKDWIERAEHIIETILAVGFNPVISPDWSCGWTRAGSWLRDMPDVGGGCESLLKGRVCLGCGRELHESGQKAICLDCSPMWSKRDMVGVAVGNLKMPLDNAPAGG